MSDHHHSSSKKTVNREGRRAEAHALHEEALTANTEQDLDLGEFEKDNIQTGAGSHEPMSDGNRDWAIDERQAEAVQDDLEP